MGKREKESHLKVYPSTPPLPLSPFTPGELFFGRQRGA